MNRKTWLLLVIVVLLPMFAFTQNNNEQQTDTIFLFNDEPMSVDIKKLTRDSIIYSKIGLDKNQKVAQSEVHKIKYRFGNTEVINKRYKEEPKLNWRKVKVLDKEIQAEGMQKVQKIDAKAKGSDRGYETPRSLKRRALVILRKKAANMNADHIVIVNETVTAAFGEIPSVTLEAIAYRK